MIRTYRYPLRPTQEQAAWLERLLSACCDLYNGALQERRDAWRKLGKSVSLYDQTKSLTILRAEQPVWFGALPVEPLRSALRRLDRAFAAFFARVRRGERPGYPRFKSKRRYGSFDFGDTCASIVRVEGNRVVIPKLGAVKFHLYRHLCGKILQATVRREAGKWFVCFQLDLGAAHEPPRVEEVDPLRAVGIDVGLSSLVALSTGETHENPRYAKQAAAKVARAQRDLARKRRGSKSRRRAVVRVQRAHQHVRNQRLDHARKIAADLCARFDLIAHENLNLRALSRGMLGKSVNEAAWGTLLAAIACKAESAGKRVVAVDPRGTSQRCSQCGEVVPKTLADRYHDCHACGVRLDRDVNAAINIENLALGRSADRPLAPLPVTAEAAVPAGDGPVQYPARPVEPARDLEDGSSCAA